MPVPYDLPEGLLQGSDIHLHSNAAVTSQSLLRHTTVLAMQQSAFKCELSRLMGTFLIRRNVDSPLFTLSKSRAQQHPREEYHAKM